MVASGAVESGMKSLFGDWDGENVSPMAGTGTESGEF